MTSGSVIITTKQLAALVGVDPSTVRRWVEVGKLEPSMTTPGGHHRFLEDEALAQLSARGRLGATSAERIAS